MELHGDGQVGGGDEGDGADQVDGVEHAPAELGLERESFSRYLLMPMPMSVAMVTIQAIAQFE